MEELKYLHDKMMKYIKENYRGSFQEPHEFLRYKFLDPAAVYKGNLWDWDSFFCGVGLIDVYEDTAEYLKGCVDNFLDYLREDGSIPYTICGYRQTPSMLAKNRKEMPDINSAKPLIAQMALLAYQKLKGADWIKEIFPKLQEYINHWEQYQQKSGLFVWCSCRGSGTDNHPAIYGRPLNSSAGVELNCFMLKEYEAISKIAQICKDSKAEQEFLNKTKVLAENINTKMWDEIDGMYYHLDMLSEKPTHANQHITWEIPLKFRVWTCFMPMWAGIAPEEHAKRMVDEHLCNENEFWSAFGLRTLAKNEPIYNTEETSNPSNWQGPIWVVSTYLMFRGLINYGYFDIALKVAKNLLNTLCKDLEKNGTLHEYYNPETGMSNINKGFLNWNSLAGLMYPELLKS